jgi:hypothetical protein
MSFLRHVGKVGDRKVAVVFRQLPGEDHMCLVTYTETLNMHVHDPMMKCIESEVGQGAPNLADGLNRTYTKDGRIILQVLHSEGLLKKVQTSQVMMTPNSNTKIRLDELNKILNEMERGEEAVKRLADIDKSRGIQDPGEVARRMRGDRLPPIVAAPDGVIGDTTLASNLRQQATKMSNEAKGLLAEADRLLKEANQLEGPAVTETSAVVKKRGRPAKAKVLAE